MPKAIIIGASSGIGRELAKVLAREGYEVGLAARRKELLLSLKQEIGKKSYVKVLDVSLPSQAMEDAKALIEEMGGVDLVVLSSGVGFIDPDLDWEKEKMTIDVNVSGFCAMANVFMNYFISKERGHFVGISSIAAIRGSGVYSASKAFVSNYLEGLRRKVFKKMKKKILVTEIQPGFVDTDMAKGEGIFWMISAQTAAEMIYQAILKKKYHAYIGPRWRVIAWLLKCMPRCIYDRIS